MPLDGVQLESCELAAIAGNEGKRVMFCPIVCHVVFAEDRLGIQLFDFPAIETTASPNLPACDICNLLFSALELTFVSPQRLLAHFYTSSPDAVKFPNDIPGGKSSYWEKLKLSLAKNLPRDLMDLTDGSGERSGQSLAQAQVQQQALAHFWAFLNGLLVS